MPQGPVPGVVDATGATAQVIVSASTGHDGSRSRVGYGIASASGMAMDSIRQQISLGNGYRLSFQGGEVLGPVDQFNLEAEASRLAASPRFRNEILPILKPVAVTSSVTDGNDAGGATPGNQGGISFVAPEITEATCVGDRYSYDNLQGLGCDDAKSILQTVSDTGTPFGARGRETPEFKCFWVSLGEKADGHADVTCRHQNDAEISLDAYFLRPVIGANPRDAPGVCLHGGSYGPMGSGTPPGQHSGIPGVLAVMPTGSPPSSTQRLSRRRGGPARYKYGPAKVDSWL